jgi:hypothetical protein
MFISTNLKALLVVSTSLKVDAFDASGGYSKAVDRSNLAIHPLRTNKGPFAQSRTRQLERA